MTLRSALKFAAGAGLAGVAAITGSGQTSAGAPEVGDEAPALHWADGKILHIDKAVKTSSAGQDVAAKLAELRVARR